MPNSLADLVLPFLQNLDADAFLFSGAIGQASADEMVRVIDNESNRRKNVVLFLTTGGGDPNAAYRIGRALNRHYESGTRSFFIGGYCKSAGTLLALCASELIFSSLGELGPLDVQIGKPNELTGADSGLDLTQALQQLSETAFAQFESQLLALVQRSGGAISTKLAAEIATSLTVGIMSPIAGQVDPLRLGFSWRANQIGVHYGELLASSNVKKTTVNKLVNGYPAHAVVIDEIEAGKLFDRVRHANPPETRIFEQLRYLLREPVDPPFITNLKADLGRESEPEPDVEASASNAMEENHEKRSERDGDEENASDEPG